MLEPIKTNFEIKLLNNISKWGGISCKLSDLLRQNDFLQFMLSLIYIKHFNLFFNRTITSKVGVIV